MVLELSRAVSGVVEMLAAEMSVRLPWMFEVAFFNQLVEVVRTVALPLCALGRAHN